MIILYQIALGKSERLSLGDSLASITAGIFSQLLSAATIELAIYTFVYDTVNCFIFIE